MRTVSISWDQAAGRFTALGRHRGQVIAINAPPRPTEEHRAPTGFSATELLLAGAGSCAAWDVVEILRKRRADVTALDVAVDGEQDADPPWTYRSVTLHFRIAGEGLKVPVLARVIRLAIVRYCSVITTLAGTAAIAATVELVEGDGSTTGRVPIELALPAVPLPPGLEPTDDEDEASD
jgi:putative redox protein